MLVFFTSDLHLGHENAIQFTNRPFANINEMNAMLIHNINDMVDEKDELWILGDFAYRTDREEVRRLRNLIKCRHVHLVKGNHDKDYSGDHLFQSIQDYKELKTDYGKFVLFHYPIQEWNTGHYGTVHLHGHIHSTGEYNVSNLKKKYIDRLPEGHTPPNPELPLRIYDVGVDANDYHPISLDQIAEKMNLIQRDQHVVVRNPSP